MNRAWCLLLTMAAALAACQRETNAPVARSPGDTRVMGAASAPASAQVAKVAPVSKEDLAAGRAIAAQGAPGAAACSSCHGAAGEGNPHSGFPRLAALGRLYIEHQLNSYADGTRANPVMTPIAGALSAQQRTQVAAYFAALGNAPPAAPAGSASAPALVVRGDDKRSIQACANCHGPQGIGDAATNPYLAGQNEAYVANALAEWKSGARHNDASGQMPAIAKQLTDAEARTIAAYYASLPAPAPRNAQAAASAQKSASK